MGFKGKLGNQFVLKRRNGQAVMASRPNRTDVKPSAAQTQVTKKFKSASDYAKKILKVPEYRTLYQSKVQKGQSAYMLAVGDYFSLPWVESIDTKGYQGNPGDQILILASDDFMVRKVLVSLVDAGGNTLESGECQEATDGNGWIYTATTTITPTAGVTINVIVYDLPKHFVTQSLTL